ncbi:hypothetical protein [Sabulicella glaciei]|nr:hypothetical protein [Roseococcus sp. MDT2-1-1]
MIAVLGFKPAESCSGFAPAMLTWLRSITSKAGVAALGATKTSLGQPIS